MLYHFRDIQCLWEWLCRFLIIIDKISAFIKIISVESEVEYNKYIMRESEEEVDHVIKNNCSKFVSLRLRQDKSKSKYISIIFY